MADADGDEFHGRAGLDLLDDEAQVPLEVVAGIHRKGRIVDRRAVRDHHQDAALLGPAEQALVRPVERLAVDVLLEQALAHHQAEILARAAPGRVGGLVDDVAQIVEAAGIGGLADWSHISRDCPPFQARVVKPRISTLTPQRSSVRARMSAQVAATVIGRPRMEPELSRRSVTTVSRKFGVLLAA